MNARNGGALACVTGRFQPVHNQHLELFTLALAEADHLIVAVTNPDLLARHEEPTSAHRHTAEANPFTYYERARMITSAVEARDLGERVTIVPFDLTRPQTWAEYVPKHARHFVRAYSPWERHKAEVLRQQGYEVTVFDGDSAHRIASTDIRDCLRANSGELPQDSAGKMAVPSVIIPTLKRLMPTARSEGS